MDDVAAGTARDRDRMREDALLAAREVASFCASTYGPRGGTKLVGDVLLQSGASALREAAEGDAAVRPYLALARDVQAHVGDQATGSVLLAARLVAAVLEGRVPVPAALEALDLVQRQVLATLAAQARPVALEEVLDTAPLGMTPQDFADGLATMAKDQGVLDLERIHVQAGPEPTRWFDGLLLAPQHAPDVTEVRDAPVAVCSQGWVRKPRQEVGHRITSPTALAAASQNEAARVRAVVDALRGHGVRLLVCGGALDSDVCAQAASAGILVWTDAPHDARRRILEATAATEVHGPLQLEAAGLGRADLCRRPRRRGGWSLHGPGPAWTLLVQAHTDRERARVLDHAERVLRTAGALWSAPQAVPGGGRWQRSVADALQRAVDVAPGKAPLTVRAAASVFGSLADEVVRNAGHDPMDVPFLEDAASVLDPWPSVRLAVAAAFGTARTVLRLDGRHDKRPSAPTALRGGTGPSGSPRGMPGDVPPLM